MSKLNVSALDRAARDLPDTEAKVQHYLVAIQEAQPEPEELARITESLVKQDVSAVVMLLQRFAEWALRENQPHYRDIALGFLPKYQFLIALPAAKRFSTEELESRIILAELRGNSEDLAEKIALTLVLSQSNLHRGCSLATRWWASSYVTYDWIKNSTDVKVFRRKIIRFGIADFPIEMLDFLEEIGPGDMDWFFAWMDDFLKEWKSDDWPLLVRMVQFAYSQRRRTFLEGDRDIYFWSKVKGVDEDKYYVLIGHMRRFFNLFSEVQIAYKKEKRKNDVYDTLIFLWGIRSEDRWKNEVSSWFMRDRYLSPATKKKALRRLAVDSLVAKQRIVDARMELLLEELINKLGSIRDSRMYIWPDDCRNWHWFLRSKKWIERLTEEEAQQRLLLSHSDMLAKSRVWSPRVQAALAQRTSEPILIRQTL